jgi:stage V sporulation protein AE
MSTLRSLAFVWKKGVLTLFILSFAIISGFGWYQPLVDFAGAGATIPLSGFGHSLAKGATEAAQKEGIIGAFTGGIKATAAGVSAALVFGYLVALIFRPRTKT